MRWVVGFAALAGTVVALAAGGHALRRRLAPGWRGATALTGDIVVALGLFTAVVYVLGALRAFRPVVTFVALIGTGIVVWFASNRARPVAHDDADASDTAPEKPSRADQWAWWIAAFAVLIVVVRWMPHVIAVAGRGIY